VQTVTLCQGCYTAVVHTAPWKDMKEIKRLSEELRSLVSPSKTDLTTADALDSLARLEVVSRQSLGLTNVHDGWLFKSVSETLSQLNSVKVNKVNRSGKETLEFSFKHTTVIASQKQPKIQDEPLS